MTISAVFREIVDPPSKKKKKERKLYKPAHVSADISRERKSPPLYYNNRNGGDKPIRQILLPPPPASACRRIYSNYKSLICPSFYVAVSEDYRELREFHGLGIWGNRREMG